MNNWYLLIYIVFLILIIVTCAYFKSKREGLTNINNIVLIGDSILNNSNYVNSDKSVVGILKTKTNNVFNFAKDGATINDCYNQLNKIPIELNKPETYIFISAGGNNILKNNIQLDESTIKTLFNDYMDFITAVRSKFSNAKLNILNLYLPANPRYQSYNPSIDQWNNLINQYSSKVGEMYNVINLDTLLTNANDFVYDIEPSITGSQKIANVIYLTR
jgi:hypothetical protein